MQPIRCHIDQLFHAYEQGDWQQRYYFDCTSGDVVLVTEALRASLQEIYDRVGEQAAADHLATADLRQAHAVEMDDARYWRVPTRPPATWARLRDGFAATVDSPLQRLLWLALDYNDAAYFDRLLERDAEQGLRWRAYRMAEAHNALRAWLNTQGFEPLPAD